MHPQSSACLPFFPPFSHLPGAQHVCSCLSFWYISVPRPLPPAAEKAKSHLEVPLEENVNRRVLEEGTVEARTIEDAIAVLRYRAEPRPWGRGLGGAGLEPRVGRGPGAGRTTPQPR